ncbi:MAG: hypothetical protein Q8Q60_01635 [Candidatus Chromulinivorax sp.]|nr:hypothetical protein [Candidatus Chromulinivorax sp.]
MYKKIFMMMSLSLSMMTLMASSHGEDQRAMPVAHSQEKIAEQPLSLCEQVVSLCIFAGCYGCDYRHGGVGLDMAITQAKDCLSCPGKCVDGVKSCAQSIKNNVKSVYSMNR